MCRDTRVVLMATSDSDGEPRPSRHSSVRRPFPGSVDREGRSGRPAPDPRHTGDVVARPRSWYQELTPPAALDSYVERLWVQVIGDGAATYEQPVLPDGRMDVVAVGDRLLLPGPATPTPTLARAGGN